MPLHLRARNKQIWPKYFCEAQGIIFVVDSSDKDRFDEAKQELEQVIQQACTDDKRLPVLVLANKQDMPTASSAAVLESILELSALRHHCAALSIHPAVATSGEGVEDGMRWLIDTISTRMRAADSRPVAPAPLPGSPSPPLGDSAESLLEIARSDVTTRTPAPASSDATQADC